jgi:hypothetical protein
MKTIGISGLVASLLLGGCVTAPGHGHMAGHEACMAKMHPKGAEGAGHQMAPEDHAKMMKNCPMMKDGHGMPGAAGDPHAEGDAAHKH